MMRTGGGCFSMVRICIGEVCVRSRCAAARAFDVKSVHVVARGMVLGNVERLEIVVRRFDFRPFDHAEADREENALEFFVGLADQVARADRALDAGKRKIDLIARRRGLLRGRFDFLRAFLRACFDVRLELVQFLADDALQFRRRRFQPVVGDQREDAGLAASPVHDKSAPAFRVRGMNVRPARRIAGALRRIVRNDSRRESCAELRERLRCGIGRHGEMHAVVAGTRPAPTRNIAARQDRRVKLILLRWWRDNRGLAAVCSYARLRQVLLRRADQRGESFGIAHGHVRQNLAVEVDAAAFKP